MTAVNSLLYDMSVSKVLTCKCNIKIVKFFNFA